MHNKLPAVAKWIGMHAATAALIVTGVACVAWLALVIFLYFFGDMSLAAGTTLVNTLEIWSAVIGVVTPVMLLSILAAMGWEGASYYPFAMLPLIVVSAAAMLFVDVPASAVWDLGLFAGIGVSGIVLSFILDTGKTKMVMAQGGRPQADASEGDEDESIAFPAMRPKVSFANVVGMRELKERLLEASEEITGKRKSIGAQRNGIMLFGDPGNGKTFMVEALAGELKLPLLTITFGSVNSRWIGQTTEQVTKAFRDARAQAPCVMFLDEVDSLLKDRYGSANASDESSKTTNTLLTELVNTRKAGVVIVAATNHLDKLDQAAIREGRFDFKIEVPPPDEEARAGLIQAGVRNFPNLTIDEEAISLASKRWEGFSVARIRAVMDQAGRQATKSDVNVLAYSDLQDALRQVQGRAGKLPTDAVPLSGLTMPDGMRKRLEGLASRMRNVEEVEAMGGKVPSGILFYGPPGTGKTATAQALAKSSGWAFLAVSGNDLIGNPERIDELVREARDIRPVIVFIDEADDVLADRRNARQTASVTNRLLTAVDGAGGKVHDIVWVAATNHPDQLDDAAVRGGRFGTKIEFELPDVDTIATFISKWKTKCRADFAEDAADTAIAAELFGLSIANIASVMQEAVDLMVERAMASGAEVSDRVVALSDILQARASIGRD